MIRAEMTIPWPEPATAPPIPRCASCHRSVPSGKLTDGLYGSTCATELGLTTSTPRLRTEAQTGPTLFDDEGGHDDDDYCDG